MSMELDHSAQRVYLALLQQISSGELAPDKQLPSYDDLTQELQVDVDSVRTAVHRLQTDGYVYHKPGLLPWFVKPRSRIISRRHLLRIGLVGTGLVGVKLVGPLALEIVGEKIAALVPDLPPLHKKSTAEVKTEGTKEDPKLVSQNALRELWYQVLTLKDADMSNVRSLAVPQTWFQKYESVNEAHRLGIETVLNLIQELSWQESEKDRSDQRERFLKEAEKKAVQASRAGAAYGPLQHYVQLRQAVLLRQQGRPRSLEHKRARDIVANLHREASSFAIKLGAQNELAKLQLEAQQWSEYDATQKKLKEIRQRAEKEANEATALWRPFYDLLELEAEDVRLRGFARVRPEHAYKRQEDARKTIEGMEDRFSRGRTHRPLYGLYGIDISLNFSFARILLGSPRPRDRVDGMLHNPRHGFLYACAE